MVASKFRRSSFEPSLCDADYLWVSDGFDERIDLRLVLSQSSRVKVEKLKSSIFLFVYNPTTTHYEVTVQYKVDLLNNNETRTLNKHASLRTTTPSPPSAIFKKRINNTEN